MHACSGAQETVIEHHPVETEYVVETRPLGEHEIVDEVKVGMLCGPSAKGHIRADQEGRCQ